MELAALDSGSLNRTRHGDKPQSRQAGIGMMDTKVCWNDRIGKADVMINGGLGLMTSAGICNCRLEPLFSDLPSHHSAPWMRAPESP